MMLAFLYYHWRKYHHYCHHEKIYYYYYHYYYYYYYHYYYYYYHYYCYYYCYFLSNYCCFDDLYFQLTITNSNYHHDILNYFSIFNCYNLLFRLLGIYREVYLLRKPAKFICDFEFTSDITVPVEKQKKKPKKEFNEMDDLFDNIDEGKEILTVKKILTANVSINILTQGVLEYVKGVSQRDLLHKKEGESSEQEKQGKDKEGEKGKKISGILKKEGETFQYAVRAEMFENEAVQRGAVLTLTGLLKQVSGDQFSSPKNQTVPHLSE